MVSFIVCISRGVVVLQYCCSQYCAVVCEYGSEFVFDQIKDISSFNVVNVDISTIV